MRNTVIMFALGTVLLAGAIIVWSLSIQADVGLDNVNARLGVLPPTTDFVLSMDLAGLRESSLYKKYGVERQEQVERDNPEFMTLVQETGLDPRTDIDTLLLGSRFADDSPALVGLVTGRFEPDRIADSLRAKDYVSVDEGGRRHVFRLQAGAAGSPYAMSLAFLGNEVIVFGADDEVRSLLTRYDEKGPGLTTDPERQSMVAALDTTADVFGLLRTRNVWDRVSGTLASEGLPTALRSFSAVTAFTFSLGVGEELDVNARASCRSPEDAMLVHDAIKGMLAMASLALTEQDPDLASTLSLAQIHNEGQAITFSMRIPKEVIETWNEKVRTMSGSPRSRV